MGMFFTPSSSFCSKILKILDQLINLNLSNLENHRWFTPISLRNDLQDPTNVHLCSDKECQWFFRPGGKDQLLRTRSRVRLLVESRRYRGGVPRCISNDIGTSPAIIRTMSNSCWGIYLLTPY